MNRTRSIMDCLCSAVILNCIVFGIFGCLFSVLEMEREVIAFQNILAVLIPFTVICSFLYYSKESIHIGIPIMVVFLSLTAGILRTQLAVCLRVIACKIMHALDCYYNLGWDIGVDNRDIYSKKFQEGILILTLCMIFLLSIDIVGFLKAERIFVLSFVLLAFSLCVGKMPPFFFTFLLVMGLFTLFATGAKTRDFTKKWKFGRGQVVKIFCEERQEVRETPLHGGQKAAIFTAGCFFLALFLGLRFSGRFGEELLDLHTPIQEWANEFEYNLLHYDYSRAFHISDSTMKEKGAQGKLSNDRIYYAETEVLRVTVDEKPEEAMYLRGFIGKDYQGSKWSKVKEYDFSNAVKKWNLGNEEWAGREVGNFVFHMLKGQYMDASAIRIEYVDAPGAYAYLPYFTKISDSMETSADGVIERESGKDHRLPGRLDTQGYLGTIEEQYSMVTRGQGGMLAELMESKLSLEDKYSGYVKEQYLTVPDSLTELKEMCEEYYSREIWRISWFIKDYLQKNAEYSLELEPLPYGEDFIEYFLYSQKKGYCIHFATAAVLMYRMCRIPARFVEGYVIWPEDFKKNKDGTYTASVPDSRAHAWAEIYYEDFGFVPVDVTPPETENESVAAEEEFGQKEGAGEASAELEEGKDIDKDGEEMSSGKQKEDKEIETIPEEKEGVPTEEKENGSGNSKTSNRKKGNRHQKNLDNEDSSGNKDGSGAGTGNGEDSNGVVQKENEKALEKEIETLMLGLKLAGTLGICFVLVAVVLTVWNILRQNGRYRRNRKGLLQGVHDKKRQEVIEISCRFYAYMETLGKEKSWKKTYGDNISDCEYETIMRKEFFFLEHGEHLRFLKTVQKALYCPPEAENVVSDIDLEECRKFLSAVKKYLTAQASWYQRVLMGGYLWRRIT